jgi:hypothetical protein
MPIVTVIVALIFIGVGMWLVNRFLPMAEPYKTLLNVVVVLLVFLWLLNIFGLFTYTIPVRR